MTVGTDALLTILNQYVTELSLVVGLFLATKLREVILNLIERTRVYAQVHLRAHMLRM